MVWTEGRGWGGAQGHCGLPAPQCKPSAFWFKMEIHVDFLSFAYPFPSSISYASKLGAVCRSPFLRFLSLK